MANATNNIYFAGCYSSLEDENCAKNGTEHDMIFYNKTCTSVISICAEKSYVALNASYCGDPATNQPVPIREVVTRTLASEEYY